MTQGTGRVSSYPAPAGVFNLPESPASWAAAPSLRVPGAPPGSQNTHPCDTAPLRKRQGCAVQNPGGAHWKPPGSPQTGHAGGGMWQRKCEAIPGVWDFL